MLDIQFIRENAELVTEKSKQKGYDTDINKLLEIDARRRDLQGTVDGLRQKRNSLADATKGQRPSDEQVAEGRSIKEELTGIEQQLSSIDDEFINLLRSIPNIHFDDVPLGGEEDSVEIRKVGEQITGGRDHVELATAKDWLDFERGAKVAGSKFYFLKGDLALLENAVTQFALNFIQQKGFTYMTVPHMVNSRVATGTGFAPRTSEQSDEYYIENEDLSLIATAEMPLTGYHADEIIDEDKLPLLYAALSPCYRKEAGTYGKYTRGLFRVHQFNKLEMYAYTTPEKSSEMHEHILNLEEQIWNALNIPYRVVSIAAGDLGAPAAKKYDIEYWSPIDQKYRELTSCSNCTDYQTRNLNIRVRRNSGQVEMMHSLNGTAVSLARTLVAILENFQNDDGSVQLPDVLKQYMGGREKI